MDTLLRATGAVVAVASLLFAAGVWRLSQGPVALGFLGSPSRTGPGGRAAGIRCLPGRSDARVERRCARVRDRGFRCPCAAARRRRTHTDPRNDGLPGRPGAAARDRRAAAPRGFRPCGTCLARAAAARRTRRRRRARTTTALSARFGGTLRRAPEILRMGGRLSVLEVSDATVVARGPAAGAGETWRFARISVERRGESVFATAAATAALDGEPFDFEAEARYDPGSGALVVRTMFADLVPARLARALSPALSSRRGIRPQGRRRSRRGKRRGRAYRRGFVRSLGRSRRGSRAASLPAGNPHGGGGGPGGGGAWTTVSAAFRSTGRKSICSAPPSPCAARSAATGRAPMSRWTSSRMRRRSTTSRPCGRTRPRPAPGPGRSRT